MTGKLVAMTTITAEPTWLDDGEQRAWRAYLRGSRLLEAALDRDLQQHGVQLSEYEIISMLSEQPDRRLRMSALADSTRSRLLLVLERQELTVGEMCAVVQLPQSTVSRHLKTLADAANHSSASVNKRCPRRVEEVTYFWKVPTASSSTASMSRFSG